MSNFTDNSDICISSGIILPLVGYYSTFLWVRIIGYLIFLLYLFLGVAIISDIFMCSIERITSETKKIVIKKGDSNTAPEYIEVRIWNDTVANLTLMALGSSAPEILLAIIEIVSNGFKAGELGPGTIVGSAAFNLLVISAVCVIAIPSNESKTIKAIKVFAVTSSFSVFAYLWLFIILVLISPDIIEVWEALLTFIYFPLLVFIAYLADCDFFVKKREKYELDSTTASEFFPKGKLTKKGLAKFIKEIKKINPNISSEDAACLAATLLFENERHSRLFYRVSACRLLSGSKTPIPHLSSELQEIYDILTHKGTKSVDKPDGSIVLNTVAAESAHEQDLAVVQFASPTAVVMENAGNIEIAITRFGKLDNAFDIRIETLDRTARSGRDYKGINEIVSFKEFEKEKTLKIDIIDDNNWNHDNIFLIKLNLIDSEENSLQVAKGRICMMTVTIVDDDFPGIIAFGQRLITVEENAGRVIIPVFREQGADGNIQVKWKTIDGTAKSGKDFKGGEGIITFDHGVIRREIEIPIVDDFEETKDEYFEVHLVSADNGAKIGKLNSVMVTVTNDDDYNLIMSRLMKKVRKNRSKLKIFRDHWIEKIKTAMNVGGGEEEETENGKIIKKEPSTLDYTLHFVSFGWKILFSLIPPTNIWGGWLTFFVSLIAIGIITAIVGDTAEAFGCLTGLRPSLTAITFVALGTSLPDTFASITAAKLEKYADNAIGNVTGSNSVNVFLGLGLPWLLASVYWSIKGQEFIVEAGTLGFNVALYTTLSFICIAVLMIRRYVKFFGPGELGGPRISSLLTFIFLLMLWFVYIIASAIQIYS